MSVDPVSIHGCPVKRIEGIRKFGVQVENAAAFRADKVIMTAGIGIEVIHTVPKPKPCDLTEVSKQRQVPVDSSKTDVWKVCTERVIYHICGRKLLIASR